MTSPAGQTAAVPVTDGGAHEVDGSGADGFGALARQLHQPLEVLHVVGYFAPETTQAYLDAGLTDYGMGYFASRSAPMGAVVPELTTATFYVFSPALVAAYLPRAWGLVAPEAVTAARVAGVRAALRRGLGDLADSPEVAEAAELLAPALERLDCAGRPLAASHRGLTPPDDPLMRLWHAVTVLREHRGDGHVAALVLAGLDPVEALVTASAAGGPTTFLKSTRGWSAEQWADGERRLADRGLLDEAGGFTPAGAELRASVEARTDAAAAAPWRDLGEATCTRLLELSRPLARAVVDAGILPARLGRR